MDLISLYKQRLNLKDAAFSLIEHEDAMVAIVYKIVQTAGSPFILKVCPRAEDYYREVYFLEHLASTLPVAGIIQVIPPKEKMHGAILMHCLPGTLLKITDISDALAYEIGSLLARIHLNRISEGYGDLTQPHHLSSNPQVYFSQKFEESFSECRNHLPRPLLEKCHHYYDTHINLLASVDGPCMIHRDFRPGNVMVYNDKIQGIIDWASGRASFAEEDFCPLELGEWSTDSVIKKSFLAGYKSIRPVPNYSIVMPLLRLNRALATIGFTVKHDSWNNRHANLYQVNRLFLEAFPNNNK